MSHNVPPLQSPASYGRLWVAVTVLVSFAALYGLSLASDPETYGHESELALSAPCEEDYWRVADTSHNERIFAMRTALESRGFHLNGGAHVNQDPIASIRGVYGYLSPDEDNGVLEWRLMATRCKTCQPGSFLRLSHAEGGFALPLASRLTNEWRTAEQWFPPEVIACGQRLCDETSEMWQADRDTLGTSAALVRSDIEVMLRDWKALPQGQSQYCLQLRQVVGDYQLTVNLVDKLAGAGQLSSCEMTVHFRWMR